MKKTKKQKLNLVLRWILIVVVSVSIGAGIYNWNTRTLTRDELPMPLGVGVAVVLSGSMEPELSKDDVIFVVSSKDYSVGETVVFKQDGKLTVHKIISIDGETVITQGTANNTPDEPIQLQDIKGKVLFSLPGFGRAVDVIKSPAVTVCLIILAALLLAMSYMKEKDEDQEKLNDIRKQIEQLKGESAAENSGDEPESDEKDEK